MTEKEIKIELEKWEGKRPAVEDVDHWLSELGLEAEEVNVEKPWGAYWKIKQEQTEYFLELFFPDINDSPEIKNQYLSPKILLVGFDRRLSWQYHNRRAEEWKVVTGQVGVERSDTDTEPNEEKLYKAGDRISLKNGERHGLVGRNGWGLVAEVWIHTDKNNPSDEKDIVRVRDSYGRS